MEGGRLRIGRLIRQPQLDTDIPSAMVGGQLRIRRIIRRLQLDTKGNIWKHEPRVRKLKTTRIGDSKNYSQAIKISNTPTSMKPVCNALGQCQAEKVCSTPVWESFRLREFWRHQQLSKLSAFDRPRWTTVHQIMIVRTLRGWIRDVFISSKEKGECFAPHPPSFSFQKEVLHVLLHSICRLWCEALSPR